MNYDDNSQNDDVIKIQMELLEKLINMYPYLEKEKQHIISECINKKPNQKKISNKKEQKSPIILEQFKYQDKIYYKDKHNKIWNDKAELIGVISGYDNETGVPICEMFDKKYIQLDTSELFKEFFKK